MSTFLLFFTAVLGVLQLAIEVIVDHTVMPLMESALHSTELLLETINELLVYIISFPTHLITST